MPRVILSPRAKNDINEILDYLAQHATRGVARDYAGRFDRLVEQLEAFPRCGALRERYGKSVRMLVERPFLIFYEIHADNVSVLRVLDGRRNITRRLIRGGS